MFLILVILIIGGVLTGCCCYGGYVTPPTTPPPVEDCYLVITAGYWVWGGVYANDKYVGYLDFETNPVIIIDVVCGTWVTIYIIDSCGWQSHTEIIFIHLGRNNLDFPYIPQPYPYVLRSR